MMSRKQRIQRYIKPIRWPIDAAYVSNYICPGCCCLTQGMIHYTTPNAIAPTHHWLSHDLMDACVVNSLGCITYLDDYQYCLPTPYNPGNEFPNDGLAYQVLYDDNELPTLIVQQLAYNDLCFNCSPYKWEDLLDHGEAEAADNELSGTLIMYSMNNSLNYSCNIDDHSTAKDYEDAGNVENIPEKMPPNTYRAQEGYLVEEPPENDNDGCNQSK